MSRHATSAAAACVLAALALGCDVTARQKALTTFFDGVPPPKAAKAPPATVPAVDTGGPASRQVGYREHGPYAAKLCSACHDAAATNALVVPKDELCFRCHDLKQTAKYVHGPLASGGCLTCHDPHGSPFGFLLVSESDGFCLSCHDRAAIERIAGHDDPKANCTKCHDAHGSDKNYMPK